MSDTTAKPPYPPAGWYPDPATGQQRFWDGYTWTNAYHQPPTVVPVSGMAVTSLIISILSVLFIAASWVAILLSIVGIALGGAGIAVTGPSRRGRVAAIVGLSLGIVGFTGGLIVGIVYMASIPM